MCRMNWMEQVHSDQKVQQKRKIKPEAAAKLRQQDVSR